MMALTLALIVPAVPRMRAQQSKGVGIRPKADLVEWPSRSKRWALIIGVDQYESQRITPLIGAVNDARRLAEALIEHAGFPRDQVIVLTTGQTASELKPTRNNILERLANLNGVVPHDGLFFFAFSGHGVEANNRGFLLPSDAVTAEKNERLLERTAVSVSDVQDEIFAAGVRQVVVLLDACRNDPRPGKGGGENLMSNSFDFELRNQSVEGVITFYATSPGLRAYEDSVNKQGYFSYAFIEGLKGAAANSNGEVTLERLANYLKEKVPFYVKRDLGAQRRQVPRIVVENYGAEKLVLAMTTPPPRPPRPIDPYAGEEEAWQIVRNTRNPELIRDFLKEFPSGRYAVAARLKLKDLDSLPPAPEPVASATRYARVSGNKPLVTMSFTTAKVDANAKVTLIPNQTVLGYVEQLPNGVRLEMVEVIGGPFTLGASASEEGRSNEGPQQRVTVSDFYLGKHEVTQGQWKAVMGGLPLGMSDLRSEFKGDELPVVLVSWDDAKEFIAKLNKLTGADYRLPSEAEWEYAARAGSKRQFAFGETITREVANYWWADSSSLGIMRIKKPLEHPMKVGSYPANAFGLYDMHGNVWEWCEDNWHGSYQGAPNDGRAWVDMSNKASSRVVRGGSCLSDAALWRSAYRVSYSPDTRNGDLGFRLSRTAQ